MKEVNEVLVKNDKKPDKEGLKHSLIVFIVTAFSESQNRHKWSHF
jgi:hypothetical protein